MNIKVTDTKTTKEYNFKEGISAAEAISALGFDFPMPCGGKGTCGKCRCVINGSQELACKKLLFKDSVIEIPAQKETVLSASAQVDEAQGVVVDIGTTTLAAALFEKGNPVKTVGKRNPQCAFGADVISRIGAKNPAELTKAIRNATDKIRKELGESRPTVIVGNTAMLSLFAGLDPREMGTYPFKAPSLFDIQEENVYFPPCASAFIGADALCSLLRSGATEKDETALVMDLGTNGEIALVHQGEVYFSSTAAGPAMEGVGIKYGMSAREGAIFHVDNSGFKTIGDKAPRGICASALVDSVALMLKSGYSDRYGYIEKPYEIHNSSIYITEEDMRNFQLCKGAVSAVVKLLLKRCGAQMSQVKRVYLSGALGESITVENAVATGLLPPLPAESFVSIGNGALLGGAMALAQENRRKLRNIAKNAKLLNFGADEEFAQMFLNEMNFKV